MTLASVLLALGLGLSSWAAEPVQPPAPPQEQTFGVPLFTEGLHTRYSANSIPDNALTEALNVLIDEDVDGVVVRRPGYAKCNATAITGAQTARGLWQFDASDGTKYHVAVSSWSFYEHDGDCVWTVIPGLGGAGSEDLEWDCVQALGKLWCTNGSKGIYWDGTSTKTVTGMPAGTLIDTFRNRILVANVSGNQSRLYLSGELDGEDWTVSSSPVSTSPAIIAIGGVNDGLSITCLMGAYQDTYVIGKRDSLSALYGFDRRNFAVREVSREVGCIEDRTVKEKQNSLYWLSKRGVERMRGTVIDRVSDPVRNLVDTIIATAGNLRTVTDTTQTDFEAGNLTAAGPGAPMSASISPGSVVGSTWNVTLDTDGEWSSGADRTRVEVNGNRIHTASVTVDEFSDGQITSNPTWTVIASGCQVADGGIRNGGNCAITIPWAVSVGTWSATYSLYVTTASNGYESYFFLSPYYNSQSVHTGYAIVFYQASAGATHELSLDLVTDSVHTRLIGPLTITKSTGSTFTAKATRNENGDMELFYGTSLVGTANDLTITSGTVLAVDIRRSDTLWDNVAAPASSGTYISQAYDTGVSSPTWGIISVSSTIVGNTAVALKTRVASTCGGAYDSDVTETNGQPISSAKKRCVKFRADFSITGGGAYISQASLSAGTTGQFISQCQNPGSAITSWGRLSCGEVPYNGSFSLAVSTAISCHAATRSTATWNTQIDGSVIAINTAPYVAYRVTFGDFSVFYATANPALQDCTIEWNEGETRPPAAASVYRDRYHLAYTSSTASGAKNDHQLVLDSNDKWVLWDNLNCYSLGIYERKLYCGASTDSGQVWLMDTGTADDGASFTSRFKTKAYSFGRPDIFKEFREFGAELEPEPDSSYSISTNWRYYVDRGTTSYSIGPVDLGEDSGYLLWGRMPFGTGEAVRGRYLQLEGEVSGTNSPFRFYGGLLKWRPLRQD